MKSPFVITLVSKGTPAFPRFVLGNRILIWDGENWNLDENEGLLFSSEDEARGICEEIVNCGFKPRHRFTCPLHIEVRSNAPPDIEEFKLWLTKNARLYVQDFLEDAEDEYDSVAFLKVDFFELEVEK